MRKGFKSAIALLLCFAMVVSSFSMMKSYAGNNDGTMKKTVEGSAKVEGYAELNKNGRLDEGAKLLDSSEKTFNKGTDNEIVIRKDIEKTKDAYGFDITLSVKTKEEVKTEDVAVVILIDVSGSMEDNDKDFTNTKAAAKALIDNLSANTSGECKVAIAKFATAAAEMKTWVNIKTTQGKAEAKNAIDSLKIGVNGEGTNMDAGFRKAKTLLSDNAVKDMSNKYTVMLSDGEPTYYYNDKLQVVGNGRASSKETCDATLTSANDLKTSTKSEILTAFIGKTSTVCYSTEVCELCNKSKSEHIKPIRSYYCPDTYMVASETTKNGHTYCANCGELFEDKGINRKYDNHTEYNNKWYCDASKKWKKGNNNYTVDNLLTDICGEGNYFSCTDSSKLTEKFASVFEIIKKGSNGAGLVVTDPMGQFIDYKGAVTGSNIELDKNNTLTWRLSESTPIKSTSGKQTTYEYTYKYHIELDVCAEGFENNKLYPTNGLTTLVNHTTETDSTYVGSFNVPVVSGVKPQYGYKIEYYVEDGERVNGQITYKLDKTEYSQNVVSANVTVTAPEGYQNAYADKNLEYAGGDVSLKVTKDNNTIKLYYRKIEKRIEVNYNYFVYGILEDGTEVSKDKAELRGTDNAYFTAFQGDTFNPENRPTNKNDNAALNYNYELDGTLPTNVLVKADGNVITLNYYAKLSYAARAQVKIEHQYRTNEYVFDTDKNEAVVETGDYGAAILVQQAPVDNDNPASFREGNSYVVSTNPREGSDYSIVEIVSIDNQGNETKVELNEKNEIILKAGMNHIVVRFEKTLEDNLPKSNLTVKKVYGSYTITTIENGEVKTSTVDPITEFTVNNELNYVGYKKNVDFASEKAGYSFDNCTDSSFTEGKVYGVEFVRGGREITINYKHDNVAPETTTVTVIHKYYDVTTTIDVIKDENGKVIGFDGTDGEKVINNDLTETVVIGKEEVVYKGQRIGLPASKSKEGYVLISPESQENVIADGQTIEYVYVKKTDDDVRIAGNVSAQHEYYEYATYINEKGKLVSAEQRLLDTVIDQPKSGKAGDKVTFEPEYTLKEERYRELAFALANPYEYILQEGTNNAVVFKYITEHNYLEPTSVSVTNTFYIATQKVDTEKNTTYFDYVLDHSVSAEYSHVEINDQGEYVASTDAAYYVGQYIRVKDASVTSDKAEEKISLYGDNPSFVLSLKGNDSYNYNYVTEIPLAEAEISVKHLYQEITIDKSNHASYSGYHSIANNDESYKDFEGLTKTVSTKDNGYTLVKCTVDGKKVELKDIVEGQIKLTYGENSEIVFYYDHTTDNSHKVNYSIKEIFITHDKSSKDGSEVIITDDTANPITGTTYEGLTVANAVKTQYIGDDFTDGNFKCTSVKLNGNALDYDKVNGSFETIVSEDENNIVIVYERYIDSRDELNVTVTHHYFTNNKEEVVTDEVIKIKQGDSFDILANQKNTHNEKAYKYVKHSYSFEEIIENPAEVFEETEDNQVLVLVNKQATAEVVEDENENGTVKAVQQNMLVDIYYERAYVTVNHNYYKDGQLYKTVSEYNNDKEIGELYTATPVPTYENVTYTIVTSEDDYTDQEVLDKGIVINIDYSYVSPRPSADPIPGGTTIITEDKTPLDEEPGLEEIEDEDVALDESADLDDIEDEDVALSENPLTGDDAPMVLAVIGLIAAFGFVAIFVTGRKKEEEQF